MALFRKFFYRKPPDGLLEISERVYVFDCCFTTDILEDEEYKVYIEGIVSQLRDYHPDSSFMVFNFREGDKQSLIANLLSEYDMTVFDYPRHYEGCPLLTVEMIHHFLRSSENWLALMQKNVLLMHCERSGWPVLAFMLAALLIYRKNFTGEQKTLDMIYKQAPRELLQLMSPLNPLPSQLRYLQYISRRNVGSEWPPLDRALTLDCVMLRAIPKMDQEGGCRPIFRIYGQDPLMVADRTPKVLFSTPKRSKLIRHYKQGVCDLIKIDIHCHVQGDVVMECINVDSDMEREQMLFRVMFNTAFIRSNILMLNCDEIDTLWNVKDRFPKDFRAEVLFSEMDSSSSLAAVDLLSLDEKGGLPEEAFATVQEIFSSVDWTDTQSDVAANVLQHITTLKQNLENVSPRKSEIGRLQESPFERVKDKSKDTNWSPTSLTLEEKYISSPKPSPNANSIREKVESQELRTAQQSVTFFRSSPDPNSTGEKVEPPQLVVGSQSMPSIKTSSDVNSIRKKVDSQDIHVNFQLPSQSKIISPRVSRTPQSFPYQSTPSTVGISALLHDHVSSPDEEAMSPMALASSAISSPVTNIQRPVQISHGSTLTQPLQEHSSTSLECSSEASTISEKIAVTDPPRPVSKATDSADETHSLTNPGDPVPLASPSGSSPSLAIKNSSSTPPSPSPPPSLPSLPGELRSATVKKSSSTPPPPSFSGTPLSSTVKSSNSSAPPPPPPPLCSRSGLGPASVSSVQPPPPPPPPSSAQKDSLLNNSTNIPPVPPPPFFAKGLSKPSGVSPPAQSGGGNGNVPPVPGPPSGAPFSAKGRGLLRSSSRTQGQQRKANLKPYHWLKLTRAMQGSLWAESQKCDEASKPPEFDLSELESLFSAAAPNTGHGSTGRKTNRCNLGVKSDKVHLIDLRRAYNCEIMLSKVKIPLSELMSAILALDDSALDGDQVEILIKFSPTKEETELLKGYKGDVENLGKCEQFFLELIKVPRVESKLRVFSFKLQFHTQVSDLRSNLNVVNSAAEEIRSSVKLKRIMQTILSLGNALNHGTARGSAIGFRLDSLLKLTDTRARNNKMTLMHYLCKVLAEKLPEVLDFPKDLKSLEAATKIQLKCLAEEMQAISKGLEKVMQELTASENDGQVSETFCAMLKSFLGSAESEVRSLALLYSSVGRNADALALYFGEDPVRCPFEQVVSTLLNFVKMFVRSHEENRRQLELEKKKAEKEKLKMDASKKESEMLLRTPIQSGSIK